MLGSYNKRDRAVASTCRAIGYARRVPCKGATGFDVGCEPSGAYRGAVPS